METLHTLIDYCDRLLDVGAFDDYCPNGLQVESGGEVGRIVTGVTASLALIEAAAGAQADLLLVHHGYFWKNEPLPLTGMKGARIQALYGAGISLAAYHLPLDAHPAVGNNVRLGALLGFRSSRAVSDDGLLWGGELASPVAAEELATRLLALTDRQPLLIAAGSRPVQRVAWCTGAAQSWLERAADLGFDAFITGEVSESTYHVARERGIHFLAAGHHATERYGVQALGQELAQRFNVDHHHIDIPNPV